MSGRDPYDIRWHGHRLDPYRICVLYKVTHPALAHAIKKLLCAGKRGSKNAAQDVEEAIEALERWREMNEEAWNEEMDAQERQPEHEVGAPVSPRNTYRYADPDGNRVALIVGEIPQQERTPPCSP